MILALDIETSALPADGIDLGSSQYPWPVAIGSVTFDFAGRNLGLSHALIKAAGRKISPGAEEIHGISVKQSEMFGNDEKIELAELCERAAKVRYICGYNLSFDLAIVESALKRLDMKNSMAKLFRAGLTFVDLMRPSAAFCKIPSERDDGQYKWPKLSVAMTVVCETKPRAGHHDALRDALGAKRLFLNLHKRGALDIAEIAA